MYIGVHVNLGHANEAYSSTYSLEVDIIKYSTQCHQFILPAMIISSIRTTEEEMDKHKSNKNLVFVLNYSMFSFLKYCISFQSACVLAETIDAKREISSIE